MRESLPQVCQNCATKHEAAFQYCSSCGQKNTDGKISFADLWSEFLDAVFNIESRTWLTFKNLFVPGKLTLEYFVGKHLTYLHSLRLLIITSVLFIIALSFQDFQSLTNHNYIVKDRIFENYERLRLFRILGEITDSVETFYPEQQTTIVTDTIKAVFADSLNSMLDKDGYGDKYGDSINVSYYISLRSNEREIISKHDFLKMDEDELVQKYKGNATILEQLVFKQKIKLINDESQLFAKLMGHITWAVLLLMPCLALVLYVLYFRHSYYYIEHLIYTFHCHAFFFLLMAFFVFGLGVFPWWGFIFFFLLTEIYLMFSLKRVYQQAWGKTMLKLFLLNISYLGLFFLFMSGTLLVSFLLI